VVSTRWGHLPHWVKSMAFLQELSGDWLILQGVWLPKSLYFFLADLFLWGCLEGCVYYSNAGGIQEPQTNV